MVVSAIGALGCAGLSSRERAAIDAWLVCGECTDHELDSVLALGARERPGTIDALTADLLSGPSLRRRGNVREQLRKTYAAMVSFAVNHEGISIPLSEGEYIEQYLGNFIAVYKIRAAHALAKLGGPETRPALDSAAAVPVGVNGFRADVLNAVRHAHDSIWAP